MGKCPIRRGEIVTTGEGKTVTSMADCCDKECQWWVSATVKTMTEVRKEAGCAIFFLGAAALKESYG